MLKTTIIVFLLLISAFSAGSYLVSSKTPEPTSEPSRKIVVVTPMKFEDIPTPTPIYLDAYLLFQLVNTWRTENGYKPFIWDTNLCIPAQRRIREAELNWSHDGFSIALCPDCNKLGENLVFATSNEEALSLWLNSPDHKENIEKPYTHSCIATKGYRAVQLFANY